MQQSKSTKNNYWLWSIMLAACIILPIVYNMFGVIAVITASMLFGIAYCVRNVSMPNWAKNWMCLLLTEGMKIAAELKQVTIMQLLLDLGANVDVQNTWGETELMKATCDGHNAIVQLLLDKGAEIDKQDKDGNTALTKAASKGHDAIVQLLLDKGANIHVKNKKGKHASHYTNTDLAQILYAAGARDSGGITVGHCQQSNMRRDKYPLIARIQSVSGKYIRDVIDDIQSGTLDAREKTSAGYTALMAAAEENNKEIVEALLSAGADRDITCYGRTAYTRAYYNNAYDVTELLRPVGMDIGIKKDPILATYYILEGAVGNQIKNITVGDLKAHATWYAKNLKNNNVLMNDNVLKVYEEIRDKSMMEKYHSLAKCNQNPARFSDEVCLFELDIDNTTLYQLYCAQIIYALHDPKTKGQASKNREIPAHIELMKEHYYNEFFNKRPIENTIETLINLPLAHSLYLKKYKHKLMEECIHTYLSDKNSSIDCNNELFFILFDTYIASGIELGEDTSVFRQLKALREDIKNNTIDKKNENLPGINVHHASVTYVEILLDLPKKSKLLAQICEDVVDDLIKVLPDNIASDARMKKQAYDVKKIKPWPNISGWMNGFFSNKDQKNKNFKENHVHEANTRKLSR